MSFSLQIQNGDLAISGNDYATVSGNQKLVQDLTCAIKTPMGTDDANPNYGSLIDGGVTSDGIYHESLIGGDNDNSTAAFVEAEISRVAQNYQAQQLARNQSDGIQYGKTTLTPDEILVNLGGLNTQSVEDSMLVTAVLQTGSSNVTINLPISSSS